MNILGIETSCDETAAAVVTDGRRILSSVVSSQIKLHRQFGGVVPEVAARSHIEVVLPIIKRALTEAKTDWPAIDGIAVTHGPGLPGALLVGTLTARTLALIKSKPLYGVNHVLAHIYANWLNGGAPQFPVLALIVSGGHTELVLLKDHFNYQLLGQTQDDAVGEAFDKVARMLGLKYPSGSALAKVAENGDPAKHSFPTVFTAGQYDFSFSGLKTAALRQLQQMIGMDYNFPSFEIADQLKSEQVQDMAASFQAAAVDYLVRKTLSAYQEFQPKSVVIAGGVAANQKLREELKRQLPIEISYAPPQLCTDNAAMIAALGYYQAQAQKPANPLSLETNPSLAI